MKVQTKFQSKVDFATLEGAIAAVPGMIKTGEIEAGQYAQIEGVQITQDPFSRESSFRVTINAAFEIGPDVESANECSPIAAAA